MQIYTAHTTDTSSLQQVNAIMYLFINNKTYICGQVNDVPRRHKYSYFSKLLTTLNKTESFFYLIVDIESHNTMLNSI